MDYFTGVIPEEHNFTTRFYDYNVKWYIRIVYYIFLFIYIFIIVALKLYYTNIIGYLILSIPLIVFFISYINIENIPVQLEEELYRTNYFALAVLVIVPLLTWINHDYTGEKHLFIDVLVLAIVLIMLALIDIWVERRYISIIYHIRSCLETIGITLLIFAFYQFYAKFPNLMFTS
jgi:hypothetical protein